MAETNSNRLTLLCPGQGAQVVGMGRAWADRSAAARTVFDQADAVLGDQLGAKLSTLCFGGPAEQLNQTNVSQPALYVCAVASYHGLRELLPDVFAGPIGQAAGLSLGEFTALHLAGAFEFADGLRLVAQRGRLMQEAAEASAGGMVAIIGADEQQAQAICDEAAQGEVLVCANFNAPGQIVISGHASACGRSVTISEGQGLRAKALTVAGAFHSPLMAPAAHKMEQVLQNTPISPLSLPVWSNVTAQQHDPADLELLRRRLVEQITQPVRWSQICQHMADEGTIDVYELAPGSTLRGLMRRIDRSLKVGSHDEP